MEAGRDEPRGLEHRLWTILAICRQMNSVKDCRALLDLIVREAKSLMDADGASIFVLDRDRNELWSRVAFATEEILRFDARRGVAGAVVSSGQTINVPDTAKDPRFYPDIDRRTGYQTRNLLATPLETLDGEIIGVFEVLNKHEGSFTTADEATLKELAAQAGIAIDSAQLVESLGHDRDQLLIENRWLRKEVQRKFTTPPILGTSGKLKAVLRLIDQIRDSPVNVLITGESGTGKELVAKAIHYSGSRALGPFVALNCAALPENLVESELFGIEKGVATGVEGRIGKFEAAAGGTLFLDEVGDLSPVAQAKLLRALDEHVIERVGGRRAIRVDVRVLAATNKDLEAESKGGCFRADLYYRLNVVRVRMPPLRDLPEDIPLLARHFLARCCREFQKEVKLLAPSALRWLTEYGWPGNARELENEMKRLAASGTSQVIAEEDLSEAIRGSVRPSRPGPAASMKEAVADLEKRMIVDALCTCRQNQRAAAKALGVSRQGLIKKMKRYGINPIVGRG